MSFPANSRYQSTGTARLGLPDGSELAYLRRRFVPQPDQLATYQEYPVAEGDRLDNIAARLLGDPELFWRICDANRALRPAALVEAIGRRLRITLPDGIPGAPDV
jgi:hypothetical protein